MPGMPGIRMPGMRCCKVKFIYNGNDVCMLLNNM